MLRSPIPNSHPQSNSDTAHVHHVRGFLQVLEGPEGLVLDAEVGEVSEPRDPVDDGSLVAAVVQHQSEHRVHHVLLLSRLGVERA